MSENGYVDITGLPKGAVLAALYNASRAQGMGFLHYDPKPMTPEMGDEFLKRDTYFDYMQGRVMKVDLKSDTSFDPWLYDRDNGDGKAQMVIDALRSNLQVSGGVIDEIHKTGVNEAADIALGSMREESRIEQGENVAVMTIGLADVADILRPHVVAAKEAAAN